MSEEFRNLIYELSKNLSTQDLMYILRTVSANEQIKDDIVQMFASALIKSIEE